MRDIKVGGLFTFILLAVSGWVNVADAKDIRQKPEHVVMNVRIIGRVPVGRLSTIGLNYESYVFEVSDLDKNHPSEWIKVSYRFHQREPRMSTALWDYSLLHRFRMTRDRSCDESWKTISKRYVFDRNGNFTGMQDAFVFTENAPKPTLDLQTVLPCYTVTPQDYQSTSKNHPVSNRKDTVAEAR